MKEEASEILSNKKKLKAVSIMLLLIMIASTWWMHDLDNFKKTFR